MTRGKKQEPERPWKLVSAGRGDLLPPYKLLHSLGKAPLYVMQGVLTTTRIGVTRFSVVGFRA